MGEGWSDTVAVYLTRKENHSKSESVPVGWYVLGENPGSGKGIRQYPYSTNLNINPHMFSALQNVTEVHDIGEIWASMLFEMYWDLVNHFSDSYRLIFMDSLLIGLMLDNPKVI
jgi:extracellular elastinolytic metalloproteinase